MAADDADNFDLVVFDGAPRVQRTGVAPAAVEAPHWRAPRKLLTADQIAAASAAWEAGASNAELGQLLGIGQAALNEHKSYGQLRILPRRRGARSDLAARPAIGSGRPPTPAEIAARAAAIRATWTPVEEMQRRGIPVTDGPIDAVGYAACPARGVVPTRLPIRRA